MPDESCRKCGEELVEYIKCKECRKPTRFVCIKCGSKSSFQYHFTCNIAKENPLEELLINNFYVLMPTIIV